MTNKEKATRIEVAVGELHKRFKKKHPEITYKNLEDQKKFKAMIYEICKEFDLGFDGFIKILNFTNTNN